MQRLTGSGVNTESGVWNDHRTVSDVRNVHDQGIAFPMTSRIPHPLPDLGARMWTSVEWNDAIRWSIANHESDISRSLHNPADRPRRGSRSKTIAYIHFVAGK